MSDSTDLQRSWPAWWWSKSRKDAWWQASRERSTKRHEAYAERVAAMQDEDPLERLKRYAALCPSAFPTMRMGRAEDLLKHMIGYRTDFGTWPRDIDWIISEIETLRARVTELESQA